MQIGLYFYKYVIIIARVKIINVGFLLFEKNIMLLWKWMFIFYLFYSSSVTVVKMLFSQDACSSWSCQTEEWPLDLNLYSWSLSLISQAVLYFSVVCFFFRRFHAHYEPSVRLGESDQLGPFSRNVTANVLSAYRTWEQFPNSLRR